MADSRQETAVNSDSHEHNTEPGSALRPNRALSGFPTQQVQRIQAIDVLRGVTVLGILIMNVQLFAMIPAGFGNPYGCSWTDAPNVNTWVIIQILYGYKDLLIFGMLFGVGIALMDERSAALGRDATRLHFRRMAVLLMFGLAHAYLIWPGDILFHYAICGCVVYFLRRLGIVLQLVLGALAYAVPMALLFVAGAILDEMDPKYLVEIYSSFSPTVEQIAAHNETYRAGWLEQMSARVPEAFAAQVALLPLGIFWLSGGCMLMGMALYRSGMFTLRYATRTYAVLIAVGLVVGLPLVLYGLHRNFAEDWRPEYSIARGRIYFFAAAPFTALGYISLIMLICRAGLFRWLTGRLAAAGQMALTNYIMQSLICFVLFYGHGFGLVGKVDRIGQMGIVAAVWVLQLVVSPIWLRHFRFGPMEWLWRSLSYGTKQPMRRGTISESGASFATPAAALPSTPHPGGRDSPQLLERIPLDTPAHRPDRHMRLVWKLAALTGMILPGLFVAVIFQAIAERWFGLLAGKVALYLFAAGVMLVATWVCLKWFDRQPLAAVGIGYDRPWIVQSLAGIAVGSLLFTACWVAMTVFGDWHSALPSKAPIRPGLRMVLGALFTLGLSFHEELLFRGYPLQVFGRWKMKPAIVATGLLFVALHIPNPGGMTPTAILNIALLHLLMTAVYLRTRSLWLPIGIHVGWNFTIGYVFGLPVSGVSYRGAILTTEWEHSLFAGNEFGPEGGLVVTFVFLIAIAAAWKLIRQRNPQPDLLATG